MTKPKPEQPATADKALQSPRAARLAEALRANLQKRKAQSRARRAGEEDGRADGIETTDAGDTG